MAAIRRTVLVLVVLLLTGSVVFGLFFQNPGSSRSSLSHPKRLLEEGDLKKSQLGQLDLDALPLSSHPPTTTAAPTSAQTTAPSRSPSPSPDRSEEQKAADRDSEADEILRDEEDAQDAKEDLLSLGNMQNSLARRQARNQRLRRPCPPNTTLAFSSINGVEVCVCEKGGRCGGSKCLKGDPLNSDVVFRDEDSVGYSRFCSDCVCVSPTTRRAAGPKSISSKPTVSPVDVFTHDKVTFVVDAPKAAGGRLRPVCRIRDVCLRDGVWNVPFWLSTQQQLLRDCGLDLEKVAFTIGKELVFDWRQKYAKWDLFGTNIARNWHFPHFLTDIFWLLHLYQILTDTNSGDVSRTCILPQNATCLPTPTTPESLLAALFVESHQTDAWSESFLELVTAPFGAHSLLHTRPPPGELMCFRSIFTANLPFHRLPPGLFTADHPFFKSHNIERSQRNPWTQKDTLSVCTVRIVFLVRGEEKGRGIRGLDALENRIRERVMRMGQPDRMKIEAEILFRDFDNKTLAYQIETMQGADIVLAAHGAANANWIYLRENAMAIEVFPFGYDPPQYATIARIMGVTHHAVIADPDHRTFVECMRSNKAFEPENLANARERVLNVWNNAVRAFATSGGTELKLQARNADLSDAYPRTRPCVRLQVLNFNVEKVAELIARRGIASMCSATKNVDSSSPQKPVE